jgi:hypothetical protein
MANAREFGLHLDSLFQELVEDQIAQVTRLVALEALSRVVMKSPVDTGRFRGNWQVSIGGRATGTLARLDPSGQQTIAAGAAVIARLDRPVAVFITNNLPYANRLENGWSKQAPTGMVAVTIAEINTHFRSA